jgi:hypothetical protein
MALTYGQVAQLLEEQDLGWRIHRADLDSEVHIRGTGAEPAGEVAAQDAAPVAFADIPLSANPHLALRRLEFGDITVAQAEAVVSRAMRRRLGLQDVVDRIDLRGPLADFTAAEDADAPPDAGVATVVDWRNRFGRNWITSIRDQNGCQNCWAFASVALIEAMVMIEHSMWTRLSEGDVVRGVGKVCASLGNIGECSTFFANNGVCDPASFAFSTTDPPYTPTADRNGRSVRGPAFNWIGSVAEQKRWLDEVGPIIAWFEVYNDLFAHGSGVYRHLNSPSNTIQGSHLALIVGYDDNQNAWLVKNSWGTNWGVGGFGWIAYGESNIDTYAKAGLTGTNPDPWTKRRLHNGNLYESGNGALHRNLEVVGATGSRVLHRWREGGPPWTWGTASQFGNDAAVCPTLTGTTYNRNMELLYLSNGRRVHHWWTGGGGAGPWNDGGLAGPGDYFGVPGLIQGDYGAPGNFEAVVRTNDGRLAHLWRRNGPPWTWSESARFGSGIALSGASLVQSDYLGHPQHGNLEVVAVLNSGVMQHFWRNAANMAWSAGAVFGSGIGSPPVMIQGQYGMRDENGPHGNFELCVAVGGRVQHWWRDNATGSMAWRNSATFGHNVQAVAGMCQGSWSMNLEVIVLRTDQQLQHYWRDGGGWHEGPVIGPA